jgi:ElaB/YqjD/DUF883 family membrane-anchored ribosome-binding protein
MQDAAGDIIGDPELQGEGKANQALGKAQSAYAQTVSELRDYTIEQPMTALLMALGVGLVLGVFISRR